MTPSYVRPQADNMISVDLSPDSDRGTGRTHAMVMSLPNDGEIVTVFVCNRALMSYVSDMIHRLRGSEFRDRVNLVTLADEIDAKYMRGRRLRADHTFFDHAVDARLVEMVRPILR